jgi:hypothetical protein
MQAFMPLCLLHAVTCRDWYCNSDSFIARYLSKLVTAWLPGILLTLWQGMVLPLCMLLLSQVC